MSLHQWRPAMSPKSARRRVWWIIRLRSVTSALPSCSKTTLRALYDSDAPHIMGRAALPSWKALNELHLKSSRNSFRTQSSRSRTASGQLLTWKSRDRIWAIQTIWRIWLSRSTKPWWSWLRMTKMSSTFVQFSRRIRIPIQIHPWIMMKVKIISIKTCSCRISTSLKNS